MNAQTKLSSSRNRAQAKAWAFFMFPIVMSLLPSSARAEIKRPVVEEMTKDQKITMIKDLLIEGDRLTQKKDYNLANATYESVFLVEPNNLEASKRIDTLKKIMVKEGVSETQLVTRVYDQEIDMRVRQYLAQAKDFLKQGKTAQARFNLQKLLLIDPLHEEANKLYKQIEAQLQKAA